MDKNRKSPAKTSKLSAHADSKRKYVSRRDSSSGSSESESSDIATRQKQSDRHSRNHHNSKEKNSLSSVRNPHSSDAHRHGEKHSLRGDKKTTKRKSNRSSSESLSHGEITRKPPVRSIPAKPTSKKPSDPQNGANVEPPVKPIKAQPELKLMDNHSDMDQNEDVLDIHADSYQGDSLLGQSLMPFGLHMMIFSALSEAYISEPDEASLEKENLKDKRSHPRIEPPTNVVRPLKRSPAPEVCFFFIANFFAYNVVFNDVLMMLVWLLFEERPQRLSRSVVAQVVNRDSIPEDEYDPTRPQIGTVASVIKVSGRK